MAGNTSSDADAERRQAAIDAILSNDEASSDDELVAHFQTFGLTEAEARNQVARRTAMLNQRLDSGGKRP